jgi:hypothetical protein
VLGHAGHAGPCGVRGVCGVLCTGGAVLRRGGCHCLELLRHEKVWPQRRAAKKWRTGLTFWMESMSINGLYPAEFLIMFLQHSNVLLSQRNKAFPWLEMSPQSAGTLNWFPDAALSTDPFDPKVGNLASMASSTSNAAAVGCQERFCQTLPANDQWSL